MNRKRIITMVLLMAFTMSLFATQLFALSQDAQLEFEFVKFFESPYDPMPEEQREYNTAFPKSRTRYVNYLVGAKNLLYNVREQNPRIAAKFYKPDGSLLCEIERNQRMPADWKNADLWHGWGWNQPGNWSAGVYRVDIYFGRRKVGEGQFAIYE